MSDPQKKQGNVGLTIFFFLLAGITLYLGFSKQFVAEEDKEQLAQDISNKVIEQISDKLPDNAEIKSSEYPDFNSLERLKSLNLVTNFTSWTPDSNIPNDKVVNKIVLDKGSLSKAYIYVRASLDNKALTRWESIYMKMNNIGGHLFRSYSLPVPESDKTELLYALDEVPYLSEMPYSEKKTPVTSNWFKLFSDGAEIDVLFFISSLHPAILEDVTLYYECKDGSECLVSIHQ